MKEKISEKMSFLEKLSFGAGNMGICLMTTIITAFAMYFYTDVVGISVAQAGTIIAAGGIADAISDALMGVVVDRTNTKWGKCRPYLLFCALPLAVACFLVFHVPEASASVKYIYCLITYIVYTLAYTAVLIPQNVLITAITSDEKDRLSNNMFGTLGTNFGQLIPNALALTLVAALGGGSEYRGYNIVIVIFGLVGAALIVMDGMNTRERMNMGNTVQHKISAKDTLRSMANGPWIICTVSMLLIIASVVIKSSTTVYYASNVLGNASIASTLLSISNIVAIPVTLVIPFIASRIGNRNLVWCGCVMGVIGGAETQTESAIASIEVCYVWIPIIVFVVIFVMNLFFKLDKQYPQIKADN